MIRLPWHERAALFVGACVAVLLVLPFCFVAWAVDRVVRSLGPPPCDGSVERY